MSSNLYLLCRPTQSGKTFCIINYISEMINSIDSTEYYHIIFVSNNLLETMQMNKRLDQKLPGDSFILSSKNKKCKNHREAMYNFIVEDKKIMICCKNPTRLDDVNNIVSNKKLKFCIWIDEADDMLKLAVPYINEWIANDDIIKTTMITATPEKVIKKYPKINIIKQKQSYDPDKYVSLKDCKFYNRSHYGNEIKGYADQVLKRKKNSDCKIKNSDIFYIPAGREKSKHHELKDCLVERHGFNVLIINGDGWTLYGDDFDAPQNITIKNEQPSEALAYIYNKYKLNTKPFVITGCICIGRGVTLMSREVQITYAIFSQHFNINKDNAYQAVGRLTGNNKSFINKMPRIFCTPEFKDMVLDSEKEAMN